MHNLWIAVVALMPALAVMAAPQNNPPVVSARPDGSRTNPTPTTSLPPPNGVFGLNNQQLPSGVALPPWSDNGRIENIASSIAASALPRTAIATPAVIPPPVNAPAVIANTNLNGAVANLVPSAHRHRTTPTLSPALSVPPAAVTGGSSSGSSTSKNPTDIAFSPTPIPTPPTTSNTTDEDNNTKKPKPSNTTSEKHKSSRIQFSIITSCAASILIPVMMYATGWIC
ncbi:hypothetical protein BDF22DRAFT_694284 [Syncephalis plumigaleata]|nr:hypothetical protein BDF22DRAFT_694284 [Syncephalis plumigaleata]